LSLLAAAERSAGDHTTAAQHLREALRLRRNPPDPPNVLFGLRVLAWLAADDGHYERAAMLLGAADQVNRTYGLAGIAAAFFPAEHAASEQRVHQALGTSQYDEARNRGADRAVNEAIDLALSPTDEAAPPTQEAVMPRPDEPAATLTDREERVASLIAQGLTNRQIAEALVISPSMATAEVGRIRRKLGLSTRSQIAAWVAGGPSTASGSGSPEEG
jgi:non-specific serine/threonine protein kinase